MHGLAAILSDDLVVVFIADDRDVGERRNEFSGVERWTAEDAVNKQHQATDMVVRERTEAELSIESKELDRQLLFHLDALDELGAAANERAVFTEWNDIDHHIGRALLNNVQAVVDFSERALGAQGAFNNQGASHFSGIHGLRE